MSYFTWQVDDDIPLSLRIRDASGSGVTGLSPEVAIRRYRDADGGALDNFYWDGVSDFQAAPNFITMTEVDATNNPGAYEYLFAQTAQTTPVARQYLVYYRHTVAPVGFDQELHVVTDEHAAVLQEFADIKDGDTTTFDGALDSLRASRVSSGQEFADIKDGSTATFDGAQDSLRASRITTVQEFANVKDGDTATFDGTRDSLKAFRERAMGMLQENIMLDNQIYDDNRLLSARLRLFDSAVNVPASAGGSEVTGKVGEYLIEGQYDAQGLLVQFRFTRVS